jgi:hypothetical protein
MVDIPKYRHPTFCWVNDNFNQIGTNVKKWVFVFQSLLWLTEGQNIILLWLTGDSILGTANHIAMDKQGILFHNFDTFILCTKPIKKILLFSKIGDIVWCISLNEYFVRVFNAIAMVNKKSLLWGCSFLFKLY